MGIKTLLAILALGIAIAALAINYLVRANPGITAVSGYLILMDQKVSQNDYQVLGMKDFSTIIYLPSSNAEGIVTSCSFVFPEGVNESADITKDGRIDYADLYLVAQAYGCTDTQPCWNEAFTMEQCYFTYSGRRFQDPSRDCYINDTDLNLVKEHYGETTNPSSASCDLDEACRADVNKDGKIDIMDVAIVAINYGYAATEQKCTTSDLENLGGNRYRVRARGRGLYYVGVSYRIALK